jgi:hypothetical protein
MMQRWIKLCIHIFLHIIRQFAVYIIYTLCSNKGWSAAYVADVLLGKVLI